MQVISEAAFPQRRTERTCRLLLEETNKKNMDKLHLTVFVIMHEEEAERFEG